MKLIVGQTMYRAQIRVGSNYVSYERWRVVQPTPKGAWIVGEWFYRGSKEDAAAHELGGAYGQGDGLKWTPEDGKFCSSTEEDAVRRLKARTRSYVRHAKRRLKEAQRRASLLELPVTTSPGLRTGDWFKEN